MNLAYFILDVFIVLPLGWGFYKGYARGILAELVGTIHFAIAFAISFYVVSILFSVIQSYIFAFEQFAQITFICSVGGTFGLLSTAGKYLKTEIEFDFPGSWDNIIGAIFGMLKFAIVMSFFFWVTSGFGSFAPIVLENSKLHPIVKNVAPQLMGVEDYNEMNSFFVNSAK